MLGVELQAVSMVLASKPCVSECKAPTGEGEEPASAGILASVGRGTDLEVSKNTSRSTSSSETDSSASSSLGT